MIRVIELAVISIVLAAAAILGFMYLKSMLKIGHEATKLSSIIHELENTFILLKPARYRVCLDIAGIVENSTVLLNNRIIIVSHVVKIYIGNMHCSCVWYRSWLCFNPHKLCGVIDLSRFNNRYYIIDSRYLCGYVNVWVNRISNLTIIHVAGG